MPIPDEFPAFLATKRDDAVDRGPTTLSARDLPDGDVTIRVDWSSINYKDALATVPKGQVAQISPLVPGIDLAGEVVDSDDDGVAVGAQAIVTGYDLGVRHGLARLGGPSDPRDARALAEAWAPWRSYASQYLWQGPHSASTKANSST